MWGTTAIQAPEVRIVDGTSGWGWGAGFKAIGRAG